MARSKTIIAGLQIGESVRASRKLFWMRGRFDIARREPDISVISICPAGAFAIIAAASWRLQHRKSLPQHAIQNATAELLTVTILHESYVDLLHRKNRVRLVTYQHSGRQHLKNGWPAAPFVKTL